MSLGLEANNPRLLANKQFTALSATATKTVCKTPFINEVMVAQLVNDGTTLATAAADYWDIELRSGATVIAAFTTHTGAQTVGGVSVTGAALTANTPVTMTFHATSARKKLAADTVLTLVATKAGTAANIEVGIALYGQAGYSF